MNWKNIDDSQLMTFLFLWVASTTVLFGAYILLRLVWIAINAEYMQ